VAWAKVLLPLAALALLSTVFLLAREPGGPVDIPYARLQEIARDPRMDRARLAGVAPDGTSVALSAKRVASLPDRPEGFVRESPRLETSGEDGATTVAATTGEVDVSKRTLRLSGDVRIESSAGLVVLTSKLSADLATGTLKAGPVTATAPLGGDRGRWPFPVQGGEEDARLVFNQGVRVLYYPRPPISEAP
jgi:lipopolysaccharide export system protein LptC